MTIDLKEHLDRQPIVLGMEDFVPPAWDFSKARGENAQYLEKGLIIAYFPQFDAHAQFRHSDVATVWSSHSTIRTERDVVVRGQLALPSR